MVRTLPLIMCAASAFWLPFIAGCDGSESLAAYDPATATVEQQIIHAVRTGDLDTLANFMAQEPGLAQQYDSTGKTLLHHAARFSQVEIAQYLLEHSADINAPGIRGETPLDDALGENASQEMIRFLEEHGGED